MKTLITLVTLCLVTAVSAQTTTQSSPCTDSLYLALKHKPIQEMSEREYTYFTQKDKSCNEFQKEELVQKSHTNNLNVQNTAMDNSQKKSNNAHILGGIVIPLLVIVVIYSLGH